ncbi:MAG: ATP-dependent DNA ligase, partial [Terriglobales bacterium]
MPRTLSRERKTDRVAEAAVPAEKLQQNFPRIDLPIRPPYPPMEARSVKEIPSGANLLYEPKWDGFRCLVFRKGDQVLMQSKAGQPLGRYFPELVQAFRDVRPNQFVMDGEIVIFRDGQPSFDDLLMRIHPAQSRIDRLSKETPASFVAFDLLVDERGKSLVDEPLKERRAELERIFEGNLGPAEGSRSHTRGSHTRSIQLSPSTTDRAQALRWMKELAGSGFDGVIAKPAMAPYLSGERAMQKIKKIRSADCVVGGFRWASKGGEVGSLLLGLYNDAGQLDHVGFTSSFRAEQRQELKKILKPLMGGTGFTGRAPGGPSRWSTERSGEWEPLDPKLVCEVSYDYFNQGRFRHGTKFLRWRPEKKPRQCGMEQVR